MARTSTTTLKLTPALKSRIGRLAKASGRSPHAVMVAALEQQVAREERMAAFVDEALAADRAIDEGAEVYAAADVHAWLAELATGTKPRRPKPWRR